jgi:poly(A) polymerase
MVRLISYMFSHSLYVLHRSGTVESKIRQLVMKLEYVETVVIAHPFVKGFEDTCYCLSTEELRTVSEGTISPEVRARAKADIEGKEGACTVYSTNFFIGLAIEPKQGSSL